MSSQSQKSQALLSLWRHLVLTSIATHTHTHTHTHVGFCGLWGLSIGVMVFYTVQTVCAIALHLNLALTGDCAFLLSPKKPHSV